MNANMFSILGDEGAPSDAPQGNSGSGKGPARPAERKARVVPPEAGLSGPDRRGQGPRRGGGRGGRGGRGGGRGREFDRRSGTGRGDKLGREEKRGGGGKGNWGRGGDDETPSDAKPPKPEADAEGEEVEQEPEIETFSLDEYMKKQAAKKKALSTMTGNQVSKATTGTEDGETLLKKPEEDTTMWTSLEKGTGNKIKSKAKKEKKVLKAGFKIKDDNAPPPRFSKERSERGGRGGARGGRGGGGAGRGGMRVNIDDQNAFPTLG